MKSLVLNMFNHPIVFMYCFLGLANTAFLVTLENWDSSISQNSVICWDHVMYDYGNSYNATSGAYKAPSNGVYQFGVTKNSNKYNAKSAIAVNGVQVARCWDENRNSIPAGLAQSSCSVTLEVKAGEEVTIVNIDSDEVYGRDKTYKAMFSWFSGHLLFPL